MHPYLIVLLVFLIAVFCFEAWAEWVNQRAMSPQLPEEFADVFDSARYQRTQTYSQAQSRRGLVHSAVNLATLILFILLGGFPWLQACAAGFGGSETVTGLIFLAIFGVGADLLNLPFALYSTFGLEARFGFNQTTWTTFILDKCKEYLLSLIIGLPLLAGVLIFLRTYPVWGWVWAWLCVSAGLVIVQYVAPRWILPWFNSFSPLEEGDLRQGIEDIVHKSGFDLGDISVMDGSKRSKKSNAFFTGLGRTKRIALFDTLIQGHTPQEVVAVLAHELGHAALGHVRTNTILALGKLGILFALLAMFISHTPIFTAFGLQQPSVHAGLIFFALFLTPISYVLSMGMNALSRSFEYAADAYAARLTGRPQDLIMALKKLSTDNLVNLTPHRVYVLLHSSHPPILKRIQALRRMQEDRCR